MTLSMRLGDGTRLDASIWRPSGPGPHPVLLMRQPYGRAIASTVTSAHPAWYAAQGYIVAVQDVRGAGTSEGRFQVYENEAEDGAEAVAWAADLPGSSGRVGMYGFSYQGASQLLAASQAPAALGAIAPAMSVWDVQAEKSADGGAFALAGSGGWAAQMGALEARRQGDAAGHAALTAWSHAPRYDGPVPAHPPILAQYTGLHHFDDWRDRPAEDAYWARVSPARRIDPATFAVPALHAGGWFDYNLPGTWAGYHALSGAPHQALVIGPWTHLAWAPRQAGHDFGAAALGDMDALQVAWFDWALKGRGGPPVVGVRVFDIGAKQWRVFARWPETSPHRLHLTGDGRVAVRGGGLSGQPGAAALEVFVHDPYRPVPATPYLAERSEIDQRTDVLAYTGAPLAAPLTLLGVPRVELAMAADAPSFDVSAVLSVVRPDGRAHVLTSGYRHRPQPGPVSVACKPVCVTLMPGERLRLSLAAAAFPAYPVNPGTGTDPRQATAMEAVPITCDLATEGSVLVLPRLVL